MPACIQARQFIGLEDPTQDPLHFVLHMNGRGADQKHGIPLLPTGNLVSGQPAAIMSYCQVQFQDGLQYVHQPNQTQWNCEVTDIID